MKYRNPNPRPCELRYARSGSAPDWAVANANEAVRLAQTVGIEPRNVFPGTRQIGFELHDCCTAYQVTLLSNAIAKSKLSPIIVKVWSPGAKYIYIDYSEGISEDEAKKVPDFKVGDKLCNRVSKQVVEVFAVDDECFRIGSVYECSHRHYKLDVKRMYKLIKSK